jgi:hypothetical protein
MSSFRFSLCLLAATVGDPATAASLTGSSPGFHYFWKQGADMAGHDAALVDCAVRTRALVNGSDAMGTVTAATGGGLLGALVGGIIDNNESRQGAAANTEGCMAIKGWSVVSLTEEQGKAMEQPDDPATIHEKLRPYIESPSPLGSVLRGPYANELAVGEFRVDKAHDLEEVSMSVRATRAQTNGAIDAAGPLKSPKPELAKGVKAPKTIKGMNAQSLSGADPANAYFVFREIGQGVTVNSTALSMTRLSDDGTEVIYDGAAVKANLGGLNNPKIAKHKVDSNKTYDFVAMVPAGRWKLSEFNFIQYVGDLCFGAPALEIKAGETIFIGVLSVRPGGGYPVTSDLSAAKEILAANPALAEKVKPAEWTNGYTSDCFGSYAYAYEMPGAPFVDMNALAQSAASAEAPTEAEPAGNAMPGDVPEDAPEDTISSGGGAEQ